MTSIVYQSVSEQISVMDLLNIYLIIQYIHVHNLWSQYYKFELQ